MAPKTINEKRAAKLIKKAQKQDQNGHLTKAYIAYIKAATLTDDPLSKQDIQDGLNSLKEACTIIAAYEVRAPGPVIRIPAPNDPTFDSIAWATEKAQYSPKEAMMETKRGLLVVDRKGNFRIQDELPSSVVEAIVPNDAQSVQHTNSC